MKKLILLTFIGSLILASGCKKDQDPTQKEPVPCFSAIPDSVVVDSMLTFNANCSEGAVSYLWDFGDGETATTPIATHSYYYPSTYTVILTVTNAKGQKSKSQTVTAYVPSMPIENFLGSYTGNETCSQGTDNYTLTISSNGAGGLTISNIYGAGITCTAEVSGNSFTVPHQTQNIDYDGDIYVVTVSGSGTVSGNSVTFTYNVSVSGGVDNTCTFNGTK